MQCQTPQEKLALRLTELSIALFILSQPLLIDLSVHGGEQRVIGTMSLGVLFSWLTVFVSPLSSCVLISVVSYFVVLKRLFSGKKPHISLILLCFSWVVFFFIIVLETLKFFQWWSVAAWGWGAVLYLACQLLVILSSALVYGTQIKTVKFCLVLLIAALLGIAYWGIFTKTRCQR